MALPPRVQASYTESGLIVASVAIDRQQMQSSRRAASTYRVPKSTLNDRCAGKLARRGCQPNSKKLS
jgi:phage FluMu gp28-like protein